ncbi:MAG: hypothetical protein M0006_12865 [Magnetospirillum sp.]|nr:hypothetical protein [Magnetospirillum sp.]
MAGRPRASVLFRHAGLVMLTAMVAGCAGYSSQTAETVSAAKAGDLSEALALHEKQNASADKDLLYYLEKGELLRLQGNYQASRKSWLMADNRIQAWEDDVRTDPSKVLGDIGSYLVNDTTRRYDGRDYEKVFLNVQIALDHLALGDWNDARTEITKMHEREAVIADYRSKEIDAAMDEARAKGLRTTSYKDLSGYPVETLDDPAVRSLTNSYESAFGNYLAGFVYEALDEPSLAAPGYRKAAEMRPNVPLVDDGLKGLDSRLSAPKTRDDVDTLLVIETGQAPAIHSQTLPIMLPIPGRYGMSLVATPVSWPVIWPDPTNGVPSSVTVDGTALPVVMLTDVNAMARRALRDEMPGIIVRSSIRAITRGAVQAGFEQGTQNGNGEAAAIGELIGLITAVASVATEVADERIWRLLPGYYSIARTTLPAGTHRITLTTQYGVESADVPVSGPYAVVALRLFGPNLYAASSAANSNASAVAAAGQRAATASAGAGAAAK